MGRPAALRPKSCSKCGEAVEQTYWKYGRVCRACRSKRSTELNRKNPERARAAGARWRAAHPDYDLKDRRARNWKTQGIPMTWDEYNRLLASQGGRCAICRTHKPGKQNWHVDHDHKFGHVRELLCGRCNKALGSMEDSPLLLRAAANYIEKHQPKLRLAASVMLDPPRRGPSFGDRNGSRLHPDLHPHGERSPLSKLTTDQVLFIRAARAQGRTLQSLADQFGVTLQNIHRIAKRKTWAWLTAAKG